MERSAVQDSQLAPMRSLVEACGTTFMHSPNSADGSKLMTELRKRKAADCSMGLL